MLCCCNILVLVVYIACVEMILYIRWDFTTTWQIDNMQSLPEVHLYLSSLLMDLIAGTMALEGRSRMQYWELHNISKPVYYTTHRICE